MKRRFSTDHLPFARLAFDPEYQRRVIPARVKKLIASWRLEDVGAVTVSIRDGKAFVIDGQHRVRAAMEQGLGNTKVLCHVYRGLDKEEEAKLFLALNDVRPVTPYDKYRAGLTANDPIAVGVRDLAEKHGWEITGGGTSDGHIACVSQLTSLYSRDPELLDKTLAVIGEAWGTRAAAAERTVIGGFAQVVARHNGDVDYGALAKKLSKYRGGPGALVGDARGLADLKSISIGRAVAELIVTTYNKGRRTGQLGAQ